MSAPGRTPQCGDPAGTPGLEPPPVQTQDQRKRDLARIHCLKKELALDDESYRNVIFAVCRKESSAGLDQFQRQALIEHLQLHLDTRNRKERHPHEAGAQARAEKTTADKKAMMHGIAAMLGELGKFSFYADGMSRKMFQVEKYEWLRPEQLHRLVAALKYAINRKRRLEAASSP